MNIFLLIHIAYAVNQIYMVLNVVYYYFFNLHCYYYLFQMRQEDNKKFKYLCVSKDSALA